MKYRRLTFFYGKRRRRKRCRMAQRKGLTMPTLLEAQQAMRVSLLNGDYEAMAAMLAQGVSPDTINIYRNTFLLSLTKALRLTYPVVQRLVGDEFLKRPPSALLSNSRRVLLTLTNMAMRSLNFFKSSNQQQLCLIWQTWHAWNGR